MISKLRNLINKHELFTYRVMFILFLSRLFFIENNNTLFILELIGAITVMLTSAASMFQEGKSFVKEIKDSFLPEDN